MKMEMDVRQFQRALNEYKDGTGKDGADVLNRAGKNVAYRASQFTPMASRSSIKSGLMADPHLRYALTAIALKKRGIGALQSPAFAKEVQRLISHRMRSSRYLKAAWAEAIIKMGGSFRGKKFKGATGFAKPATITSLLAELVAQTSQPDSKHAEGAEAVGMKPLQDAIDFVAEDMIAYAQRLLAKRAKDHSP